MRISNEKKINRNNILFVNLQININAECLKIKFISRENYFIPNLNKSLTFNPRERNNLVRLETTTQTNKRKNQYFFPLIYTAK